MISLALATALASAAVQGPPPAPRKEFAACLTKAAKAKSSDKMEKTAFTAAVRAACSSQETAFRKSLVDYDVKTGTKRADAEEGAELQVEDYLVNTTETYFESPQ